MTGTGATKPRFNDGKDALALRTIGEIASALGIKQHVLRYWEQQFPMLRPLKRSGGRRYYRPEDIALIQTIDRLVNAEGYTLKGARQAVKAGSPQDTAPVAAKPAATSVTPSPIPAILPQLRAIRGQLSKALSLH